MRNRTILIFSVITVLFFIGCDKDETRVPDFLVEFATIIKTGSSITLKLDNGNVLIPDNNSSL